MLWSHVSLNDVSEWQQHRIDPVSCRFERHTPASVVAAMSQFMGVVAERDPEDVLAQAYLAYMSTPFSHRPKSARQFALSRVGSFAIQIARLSLSKREVARLIDGQPYLAAATPGELVDTLATCFEQRLPGNQRSFLRAAAARVLREQWAYLSATAGVAYLRELKLRLAECESSVAEHVANAVRHDYVVDVVVRDAVREQRLRMSVRARSARVAALHATPPCDVLTLTTPRSRVKDGCSRVSWLF